MIHLIAAYSENFVIGRENGLLWKLSEDLKQFKNLTLNHPIIMGRKTFESLPKLLPHRYHIVISRNPKSISNTTITASSIEQAIEKGKKISKELYIIGGGEIYSQSMKWIDKMHITKVHIQIEGDTFFPIFNINEWNLVYSKFHPKDSLNEYDVTFLTYKRKNILIQSKI